MESFSICFSVAPRIVLYLRVSPQTQNIGDANTVAVEDDFPVRRSTLRGREQGSSCCVHCWFSASLLGRGERQSRLAAPLVLFL